MVPMPKKRVQEQHQSLPGVSMLEYCGAQALAHQVDIPAPDHFEGTIKAELHRGLWIARCSERFGSGAVAVTAVDPKAFCPDCGAGWFHIEFPADKVKIVAEVEKRFIPRPGMVFANWLPGESLAQLRRETRVLAQALAEGKL